MKRLLIYVEGQTEETFVRDVLAPYLWTLGLHPEPTLARTKRTRSGQTFKGGITGRLTAEAALFATPEEINEGADTHPAARILKHAPGYRKPLHGPLIANRIGLATIRSRCPHFDQWLTNLAELA